jgi:hypothetical protein
MLMQEQLLECIVPGADLAAPNCVPAETAGTMFNQ